MYDAGIVNALSVIGYFWKTQLLFKCRHSFYDLAVLFTGHYVLKLICKPYHLPVTELSKNCKLMQWSYYKCCCPASAIPAFMYLHWYFSEQFLQQYKCIHSAFLDSMWEFLSLWCVWVNSLFYHRRYSRVSWMVTFCVFWCPQQHQPDEPGLPPEPWQPGAWWAANKSAAHSGKYNHLFQKLDGQIQNVWSWS